MALQNGNGKLVPILAALCTFLGGIVVGDVRGASAARTVEERVNERLDREYAQIQRQLEAIYRRLDR